MYREKEVSKHWKMEGVASAWFNYVATHEWAAKMMGRLWNTDTDLMWAEIGRLESLPHGAAVLDVPCGGGSAFRSIPNGRSIRYCAVDIARAQLDRAQAEAVEQGKPGIEFLQADVVDLPYEDKTFDRCISFGGLHYFPRPLAALVEIARVLRPGAEVRGSTVHLDRPSSRIMVAGLQRADMMGPAVLDRAGLLANLHDAGFVDVEVRKSGLLAYYSARKPD